MIRLTRVERWFLTAFGLWVLAGLITTVLRLTAESFNGAGLPVFLLRFIEACLRWGDPVLIALAVVNTHFSAARAWGQQRAWHFAAGVVLIGAAVEILGTQTGFPFGVYVYTDRFGPRLGGILPAIIPLAWYVIVANAVLIVWLWPMKWGRWSEAAAAATLATGFDYVMEPFAVYIKGYWLWAQPEIPWQNYVSWWVISFAAVAGLSPRRGLILGLRDYRPLLILAAILGLFAVTRLVNGV